jgi:hypothetical protein
MGKGGGSKNQTSTVTQTNIPNWARPYMENALQRGQEESTRPYQAYGGQRLADQTAQTTQGLNMIQNYAQSGMPDLANARSLSEMVGNRSMDLQNYQSAGSATPMAGRRTMRAGSSAPTSKASATTMSRSWGRWANRRSTNTCPPTWRT